MMKEAKQPPSILKRRTIIPDFEVSKFQRQTEHSPAENSQFRIKISGRNVSEIINELSSNYNIDTESGDVPTAAVSDYIPQLIPVRKYANKRKMLNNSQSESKILMLEKLESKHTTSVLSNNLSQKLKIEDLSEHESPNSQPPISLDSAASVVKTLRSEISPPIQPAGVKNLSITVVNPYHNESKFKVISPGQSNNTNKSSDSVLNDSNKSSQDSQIPINTNKDRVIRPPNPQNNYSLRPSISILRVASPKKAKGYTLRSVSSKLVKNLSPVKKTMSKSGSRNQSEKTGSKVKEPRIVLNKCQGLSDVLEELKTFKTKNFKPSLVQANGVPTTTVLANGVPTTTVLEYIADIKNEKDTSEEHQDILNEIPDASIMPITAENGARPMKTCKDCKRLRMEVGEQWNLLIRLGDELLNNPSLRKTSNTSEINDSYATLITELEVMNNELIENLKKERKYSNKLLTQLMERDKRIEALGQELECVSRVFKTVSGQAVRLKEEFDRVNIQERRKLLLSNSPSNSSEYIDFEELEFSEIEEK